MLHSVAFTIQTHHFKKSPKQKSLPYSWGPGEVQLVAQCWGINKIIHIYRKDRMGQKMNRGEEEGARKREMTQAGLK